MQEALDWLDRLDDLPEDTPEADLLALIADLNADPAIHGILVQLPLPGHIDAGKVIQAIDPDKDVDGFHFINVGRLATGEMDQAFVPCTPAQQQASPSQPFAGAWFWHFVVPLSPLATAAADAAAPSAIAIC